ncbi:MAG: 3-oxoacyl-[acyl-carrier-protein] reductase [Calditrichia bacterium]
MNLKGKHIVITGSAIRVGKIIALTLAKKGTNIAIHYNTSEVEAKQTREEVEAFGVETLLLQADLSKTEDLQKMRDLVMSRWKKVDVLINNAAIFYKTPFLESTEEDFDDFMDVNLKAPYLLSKYFGEMMVQQKSGKIINIADVSAFRPWANFVPYCISKAGVVALTKGLAKALAPYVTVNAVAPGTVLLAEDADPGMEKSLLERTPLQRIGSPIDIANTVAFLLEGTNFITGEVIQVDGGRSLV